MIQIRSIHYRRRWYYALWSALLLASLAFLWRWETPASQGSAELTVKIQVLNAPPECTVLFWTGPKKAWPGANQEPSLNQPGRPLTAAAEAIGSLKARVAYRRWVGDLIPRRTDDLLILKFQPKSEAPRFFAVPLDGDWQSRLLRPGRRMGISASVDWSGLWLDPRSVPKSSR
ncbi:hypothetical protein GETHOR_28750 [Geothrix oryzae]|uniref:Uncharacterized protein n=1 Tax=Geothrix oryzae TaxID=2927975 RepID=A0ABN6V4R5_9BACT|nr:hypothetical protein [Geothrix oryzae]BDU70774.1 hypothetical protein GETHOR_28750 [Geothrix oryzae]